MRWRRKRYNKLGPTGACFKNHPCCWRTPRHHEHLSDHRRQQLSSKAWQMAKRAPARQEVSMAEIHGCGQRPAWEAGVKALAEPCQPIEAWDVVQCPKREPLAVTTAAFPIRPMGAKRPWHFLWGEGVHCPAAVTGIPHVNVLPAGSPSPSLGLPRLARRAWSPSLVSSGKRWQHVGRKK